MTTTPCEPRDSLALTALTDLYSDTAGQSTEAELDRGLNSFLARVGSVDTRTRARWPMAAAAVALCAFFVLLVASVIRMRMPVRELPTLAYRIDGGRVVEGGYLRESGNAGMNVAFNEGSRFVFTPGTRGRIREVDREGARVAIERGTATFDLTPGSSRRWLMEVGPFLVTVKGTVFTVSWDPLSEQFNLSLRRGRVVVSGPVSTGEIALRAGQRLAVNLSRAETVITEENLEPTSGEAVGASAQLPAGPPEPNPSGLENGPAEPILSQAPAASTASKIVGERRWSDDLAHGQWDRILEDVRRVGVDVTLGGASSEDLFAVADAARYRRQPDLARAALLAVRRRFPGSPRALDAIFLLGRVEESRPSGAATAIARYDEYLTRAPNGPFAGEALGRKMTLTDTVEGPARAQSIAEEYLRRFPKGSYAGAARALVHVQ
jgi:transmembrane sensor